MMMNRLMLAVVSVLIATTVVRGETLFEESFDGKLKSDWQWVRGDESEWRIHENALQMRAQHGRIWGGNDAKNLLLIRPSKTLRISASVRVAHEPKELWEQAGLLWYLNDDNFIKLISEHIKGEMFVVMARELEGRGNVVGKIKVPTPNMQLRLKVGGNGVVGQWRLKDSDEWSEAGVCQFGAEGDKRFGLFSQNGPKDVVRWIRYDDFAITSD